MFTRKSVAFAALLLIAAGVYMVSAASRSTHAVNDAGPVAPSKALPFSPSDQARLDALPRAPKDPSAVSPVLADCPRSIGAVGLFTPARDKFHFSEGLFTNGVRAFGSDGKFYVIYAGIHVPVDVPASGPMDPRAGTAGFLLVERYSGQQEDPCRTLREHLVSGPDASLAISSPQQSGALTITGVSGDVVTVSANGYLGKFNFVLHAFL
jgi:hypothetical protein